MSSSPVPPHAIRHARRGRRLPDAMRRHWYGLVVVATVAFLVITEVSRRPASAADLVWLMHSGAAVFLVALAAAGRIPDAVSATVRRLRTEDRAGVEVHQAAEILAALDRLRRRYARVGVPVGVVLMTVFWLWASGERVVGNALFWLELAAAAAAGYVVGGFVAYGRLGHVLATMRLLPIASPGHPDGAAGLRPVSSALAR